MEPTLYIIMRSDLPDLNPGKGMAQAAHAQADFDARIAKIAKDIDFPGHSELMIDYSDWSEDRSFGRTIVLSATKEKIREIVVEGTLAGTTIDPTYPWRNYYGEMFVTEEVTCGWIFVCDVFESDLDRVKDLPLHK